MLYILYIFNNNDKNKEKDDIVKCYMLFGFVIL